MCFIFILELCLLTFKIFTFTVRIFSHFQIDLPFLLVDFDWKITSRYLFWNTCIHRIHKCIQFWKHHFKLNDPKYSFKMNIESFIKYFFSPNALNSIYRLSQELNSKCIRHLQLVYRKILEKHEIFDKTRFIGWWEIKKIKLIYIIKPHIFIQYSHLL